MSPVGKHAHRSSVSRHPSAAIDPKASSGLAPDHPAVVEGRTLFPTTVVSTRESPRFLISGHNNPKLGKQVLKGPRTGWPIFHVTLEERATCPRSCHAWLTCYGSAMPYARRHRPDEDLIPTLKAEVITTARANPKGLLVRLHALGDFYSLDYLMAWAELLAQLPQLHIFGYTARREDADDVESRKIAKTIRLLSDQAWDRFAIRFSSAEPAPKASIIVDADPERPDVIVCPAQTGQTEACATCGLCWAPNARDKTIAFLRHGMKRAAGSRKPKNSPSPKSAPGELNAAEREILTLFRRLADPQGMVSIAVSDVVQRTGYPAYEVRSAISRLISQERLAMIVPAQGRRPALHQVIAPKEPKPQPEAAPPPPPPSRPPEPTPQLEPEPKTVAVQESVAFEGPSEGWTPARTAAIREMIRAGKSASEAAGALGITRNAAIGKAGRLGLRFGSQTVVSQPRAPRLQAAPPKVTPPTSEPRARVATPPPAPRTPRLSLVHTGDHQPRMIMDPEFGGCRWPLNDPGRGRMDETLFCCRPVELIKTRTGERPATYCPEHTAAETRRARNGGAAKPAKNLEGLARWAGNA